MSGHSIFSRNYVQSFYILLFHPGSFYIQSFYVRSFYVRSFYVRSFYVQSSYVQSFYVQSFNVRPFYYQFILRSVMLRSAVFSPHIYYVVPRASIRILCNFWVIFFTCSFDSWCLASAGGWPGGWSEVGPQPFRAGLPGPYQRGQSGQQAIQAWGGRSSHRSACHRPSFQMPSCRRLT